MPRENPFVWYKKARVMNVEEFHPPFSPRLEVDPKLLARKLGEAGADVVHIAAASKHAIYPTQYILMHPELKGRDLFGEIVAECKKRGIRVIATLAAFHKLPYDLLKKDHPEWMWRPAPKGRPVPRYHYEVLKKRHPEYDWKPTPQALPPLTYHTSEGLHAPLCFNSPYREAFREVVREVVTGYPLDGIFFDSWQRIYFAPFDVCYCEQCQRVFKSHYGFNLPVLAERLGARKREALVQWFSWYKNLAWEVAAETVRLVRSLKPELVVLCHGEGPYGRRDHIMNHDGFLMEEYTPLAFRLQFVSLMVNEGRICTPFIGRCDHLQRLITYRKDLFLEGIATVAAGGVPVVANGHSFYFARKKDMAPVRGLFGVMQELEAELATSEPYPFIAIPTPEITQSHSRGDAESRKAMASEDSGADTLRQEMLAGDRHELQGLFNEHVFWPYVKEELVGSVRQQLEGAFRIALSCHLPVQTVPESFLDDVECLRKYKILYLPGTPLLSGRQLEAIKKYVQAGGNLLVSGPASLYGRGGNLLKDFALNDLLGISLRPATSSEEKLLRNLRFKNGCYTDIYLKYAGKIGRKYFAMDDLMSQEIRKFMFLKPGGRTRVLANLVLADGRVLSPGMTLSKYGRGTAIYVCSGFEQRYLRQRSPMIRELFKNLLFHLIGGRPPVRVALPDTVFTLLNRYEGGWLLHLINYTGCIHEQPFPMMWPHDLPRVEWIPKITDININFNLDKEVTVEKVDLIPGSRTLRYNCRQQMLSTKLSELGDYACIRLALGKS